MHRKLRIKNCCPNCKDELELPSNGDFICKSCKTKYRYINGIPSFLQINMKSEIHDAYEKNANAIVNEHIKAGYKFSRQQQVMIDAFHQVIGDIEQDCRIIDIGCGTGAFNKYLTDYHTVVGVDMVISLLQRASKNGFIPYHADALNLPFSNNEFDLVLSAEVIQLIEQLPSYFKEMSRVLDRDGRLIVSTLNNRSLLRIAYRTIVRPNPEHSIHAPQKYKIEDVLDAIFGLPLKLEKVVWTHFPFNWLKIHDDQYNKLELLASNFILVLRKT